MIQPDEFGELDLGGDASKKKKARRLGADC